MLAMQSDEDIVLATRSEIAIATQSEPSTMIAMSSRADYEDIVIETEDGIIHSTEMEALPYILAGSDTDEAMKIIVLITDAQNITYAPAVQGAIERGIEIYTVQIGDEGNASLLKSIADDTGGIYYHENESDILIEYLSELVSTNIDIETDSDFDGLSDYHEERIRLFNGMEISLDKYDADTDGDELEDGVEVMFAKDRQGNTFFKMFSNPNIVDTDNDGIGDKEDSMALEPQSIDYLGSDRHLSAVSKRLEEKINNNLVLYSTDFTGTYKGKWGYEILMDDYYTFLEERNIETEGLYHGEYWLDEWDRYWDEYCTAFNEYVMSAGVVSKEAHYFRNNLNRIPNTLEEIINQADNWVLLNIASSEYHMYKTDFSGIGTYNLKFMSLDGRHEGVYINIYSPEHVENRGKACTQKTDPTNMGTYNYCGLYYNDANYIDEHAVLDVIPYYIHNNTKELGISGIFGTTIGRPILSNEHRYRVGFMAKDSRGRFEKIWTGQTQ